MIFESTDSYISTDELSMAVDAAVRLERPLLICLLYTSDAADE